NRPSELVHHGVRRGFVFSGGGLLSNTSALGNVTLPLRYHADLFGLDEAAIEARARELLGELRVSQAASHALPAHLSAAARRRVRLPRALAVSPDLRVLDEPGAARDDELGAHRAPGRPPARARAWLPARTRALSLHARACRAVLTARSPRTPTSRDRRSRIGAVSAALRRSELGGTLTLRRTLPLAGFGVAQRLVA